MYIALSVAMQCCIADQLLVHRVVACWRREIENGANSSKHSGLQEIWKASPYGKLWTDGKKEEPGKKYTPAVYA